MAPRILGPRRSNISAPHSRSSAARTATLSCEVISLGATQVQWLRQVTGKGEAEVGEAELVRFDELDQVIEAVVLPEAAADTRLLTIGRRCAELGFGF